MATTKVGIKYYNTYILKKINSTATKNWFVEESRIRGGYNNVSTGLSPRAFIETDTNAQQSLGNSLIYSGVLNSRTGINQTNVFSAGEDITKAVDPSKGSVQKLYAEDTNLIIFQQRKVNRALIDKDAIYTQQGEPIQTTSNKVIGAVQPYVGEWGIANNPESFAVFGYRKYFTDSEKGSVLRLSRDGITEISNYGMYDFFRDNMTNIGNGKLVGGWDIHNKCYTLSIQPQGGGFKTLNFDEVVFKFAKYLSSFALNLFSVANRFLSTKGGVIYQHYSTAVDRAVFYGAAAGDSTVTTIFNDNPSLVKTFQTINYEGASNWQMESFVTNEDKANPVTVYSVPLTLADMQSQLLQNKFKAKEDKYFANLINTSAVTQGEVIYGAAISGVKGFFATVKLKATNTATSGTNELFATSTNYIESSY